MSGTDQYGRKTWDVEEYARAAKRPKKQEHSLDDKLAISNTPGSYLHHRTKLLDESINSVQKHTLINPLNTKTYGKNKRFGFFCPVCDLSFRDNLALVDHVNSPAHVKRSKSLTKDIESGETEVMDGGVRRATLQEVVATIEALVAQALKQESVTSLKERVEKRQLWEKKRAEARRARRTKQRAQQHKKEHHEESDDAVAAAMGFAGFASTKK